MPKISQKHVVELIAQAHEGFPLEVWGILGGCVGWVEGIFPITNTDDSNRWCAPSTVPLVG
jgi:hypothetical protein